jgi:hypothetical protein
LFCGAVLLEENIDRELVVAIMEKENGDVRVLLDKDALARHIPVEEFGNNTKYIDVAYLREDKNQASLEDKMLRVMVLSCSHGGGSEDKKRIQSGGGSSLGPNKRFKFTKESTYNRFFWSPI